MNLRRFRVLVTVTTALIFLAACGPADPTATESPVANPNTPTHSATVEPPACTVDSAKKPSVLPNLDEIKVTGELGKKPSLVAPAPFKVDSTLVKVLSPGNGPAADGKAPIRVNYYGVNTRTCEVFDSSFGSEPVDFNLQQVIAGFKTGLVGQKQGSRVLIVIPGKDGYDAAGGRPPAIEKGDTLLFVVDLVTVPLSAPSGSPVAPKAGLPTVSGPVQAPTVTVPRTKPPTELVVQPLISGTGAPVKAENTITANYQVVSWKTGKVVDQSFGVGPQTAQLSRLIKGWVTAIPGHKVGSRLLMVIPPNLAYPDGKKSPPIEAGDTLVFVVDILAAY